MSSNNKKNEPKKDPYEVLGIERDNASDAIITKAYRKLALKYHPDRQQTDLSAVEAEKVSKKFHDIKEARDFLLELENKQAREEYDRKWASQKVRREADQKRESTMNKRRKTMKEELQRKEQEAMKQQQHKQQQGSKKKSSQKSHQRKYTTKNDEDEEFLEKLRKESSDLRQTYADRTREEKEQQDILRAKKEQHALKDRQVRLKWSRKRWIGESPSEHSLAKMLSDKFGAVETVELLGNKGNAALVTFANASSCHPCVDEYMDSDQMRATLVGSPPAPPTKEKEKDDISSKYDGESLQDRTIRQQAERQELLRKMQMEEGNNNDDDDDRWNDTSRKASKEPPPRTSSSFRWKSPSELFPKEYNNLAVTPFEKLHKAEQLVFENLLPSETIQQLQMF